MTSPVISVAKAMNSPHLFEPFFRGSSWDVWRSIVKAAFAEPMTDAETELFRSVAERPLPQKPVTELVCCVGRGGGKDSIASLIVAMAAVNFDPRRANLRPGEHAFCMALACDRHQASILFNYVKGYFEQIVPLSNMVINIGADFIELTNRVRIEIHATSFRGVRGRSILCTVLDECAFYRDENYASPDIELDAALEPGLKRVKGSMQVLISSVHKRSGLLYQRWRDYYGKDNDETLVVFGGTRQFNPGFSQAVIDKALTKDAERYSAEYLSRWRDDLTGYIDAVLLEKLVDKNIHVRQPQYGVHYVAGCDASGGRGDSFTLSIAHRAKDNSIVQDFLYEKRSPFSPSSVIDELVPTLRAYHCGKVTGDNYSAEWIVDAFSQRGIRYVKSELARSEVYMACLPLFTEYRARLLDNPRMLSQFAALERRVFPTGRDRVDPGPAHDDIANAAAIAMTLAAAGKGLPYISQNVVERMSRPLPQSGFGNQPRAVSWNNDPSNWSGGAPSARSFGQQVATAPGGADGFAGSRSWSDLAEGKLK